MGPIELLILATIICVPCVLLTAAVAAVAIVLGVRKGHRQ
jgi:hypothetical protein